MRFLLCIPLFIGVLSPVLTFTRLLQMKEWRWDRLREHLRREGWFRQLLGMVRPVFVGIGIVVLLLVPVFPDSWGMQRVYVLWGTWGLLAWFTLFRSVIGHQKRPVWTKKAMLTVSIALFLITLTGCLLLVPESNLVLEIVLLLLPLFSFLFVIGVFFLLLPIDRFMKAKVLHQAQMIRRNHPHLTVIGITGSVGKTTTKELLAHIFRDHSVLVTPTHVNTEMGVANLMIQKLTEQHSLFIVEMGAYTKGEIALLCSLTSPQIGIITYIGNQHLALFGSREALCRAKGELFKALPPAGHAFFNADSEGGDILSALAACPVQTVGTGGHATYEAFDIQENAQGISFTLRGIPFKIPLHGTHQVTNILLAVAAAEALNVPLSESAKRLSSFQGLPQTFEMKTGKRGQVVLDDTHNASAASFRAAIEWARKHPAKLKVLITSGLIELGEVEGAVCQELGLHARDIFQEVVFLDKKCAQHFELGFGRAVFVPRRAKFKVAIEEDMLFVCEGRMPEWIVPKLLS
jgi:UDP-N-acetylmuramoyl-tripeptide--D-alanyl-D-alanine ligase